MSVPVDQVMEILTEGDAGQEQDDANVEGEQGEQGEGPLSEEEILLIISTEMKQSASGTFSTTLDSNRDESLDYYLGNPRGDEQEGRSQATSTDVADAIEWILPQIIKAMVAKGPVIEFDAISEDDEDQADLETMFTHDVFMKENEGFLNLYEFVKDALMQKNGIFKIYRDEAEKVTTESYSGLSQQELQGLLNHDEVELTALTETVDTQAMQEREMQVERMQQQVQMMTQQQAPDPQQQQAMQAKAAQMAQQIQQIMQQPPPILIEAEVQVTQTHAKIRVDCVAPEEFRVNQSHDSLSLDSARFTSQVRLRTKSELIEDGYDPDIINNAGDNLSDSYEREYRFAAQGENVYSDPNYSDDDSQTMLEVAESYIMIDVERTGVAQLHLVTTLGADDPTNLLEIAPMEENPFVSSSCIIMAHKFYGLSIYDRLKQLQDMKTSLWRNMLDNLYLQNNREKEVVENQVNLDDLLISRPGGIKRVKAPGMIRELMVQPIGQEGYQMLEYLDQVRTGRVGVSPDTAGNVDALGSAVGSEGVSQLLSAKEELTGLMVRVVAETGVKPAYLKIRDMLVRYQDDLTPFKFRDKWVDVDPSKWGDRSRTTVVVGTGTGDDARKVGAIQQVIAYQAQLYADPKNTMVFEDQLYSSVDEFCRVSGLSGASDYFLDPSSDAGKAKKEGVDKQNAEAKQKQDEAEKLMVEAQSALGKAEMMKGQAALQSQQSKLKVEQSKSQLDVYKQNSTNEFNNFKQQSQNEKDALNLQLDEVKTTLAAIQDDKKHNLEREKLEENTALKLTDMEMEHQRDLSAQNEANKEGNDDAATI
ncbi:MAG: hypothetical protein DRI46_10930 [Chloroflexi bacterium]|nr:MAG: hypothetical protein DRI46_10930 [Chloroflexota bacterium]